MCMQAVLRRLGLGWRLHSWPWRASVDVIIIIDGSGIAIVIVGE